jgi:hypothetical protein
MVATRGPVGAPVERVAQLLVRGVLEPLHLGVRRPQRLRRLRGEVAFPEEQDSRHGAAAYPRAALALLRAEQPRAELARPHALGMIAHRDAGNLLPRLV